MEVGTFWDGRPVPYGGVGVLRMEVGEIAAAWGFVVTCVIRNWLRVLHAKNTLVLLL